MNHADSIKNKNEFIVFLDEVLKTLQSEADRSGQVFKNIVHRSDHIIAERTLSKKGATSSIANLPFKSRVVLLEGSVQITINGKKTILNPKGVTELKIPKGANFKAESLSDDLATITIIEK